MISTLPKNRFKLIIVYSLALGVFFVLTAWKAIDDISPNFGIRVDMEFSSAPACELERIVDLPKDIVRRRLIGSGDLKEPKQSLDQFSELKFDFGQDIVHPFRQFKDSFITVETSSTDISSKIDWGFSSKKTTDIIPAPASVDIRDRRMLKWPAGIPFSLGNSSDHNATLTNRSHENSYLMMTNGCEDATRTFCGQVDSGSNSFLDTASLLLPDCVQNTLSSYRGRIWFRFSGTGDRMIIRASSTGSTADMHLYRGSLSSGQCDSLICLGGHYNINSSQGAILFNTDAGREYFVLMANYAPFSTSNNMNYDLSIECICGARHLNYAPPNNFDFGFHHIRTDSTMIASNKIASFAWVIYDAAKGIELYNAFEVSQGATFEARLDGCPEMLQSTSNTDISPDSEWIYQGVKNNQDRSRRNPAESTLLLPPEER